MRLIRIRKLTSHAGGQRDFELYMSLVLAGPRRSYVLLLFRERATGAHATVPQPPRRIEHAMTRASAVCGTRIVCSAHVRRCWGRSVVGLSAFVLASDAPEPSAAMPGGCAETVHSG
jgi:hypothetical protein